MSYLHTSLNYIPGSTQTQLGQDNELVYQDNFYIPYQRNSGSIDAGSSTSTRTLGYNNKNILTINVGITEFAGEIPDIQPNGSLFGTYLTQDLRYSVYFEYKETYFTLLTQGTTTNIPRPRFVTRNTVSMKPIGLLEGDDNTVYTILVNLTTVPAKLHISKWVQNTFNVVYLEYEKAIAIDGLDVNSLQSIEWDGTKENILISSNNGNVISFDVRGIISPTFPGITIENVWLRTNEPGTSTSAEDYTGSSWIYSPYGITYTDSSTSDEDGGKTLANLVVRSEYTSIGSSTIIPGLRGNKVYRGVDVVLTDISNVINQTYEVSSGTTYQVVLTHNYWKRIGMTYTYTPASNVRHNAVVNPISSNVTTISYVGPDSADTTLSSIELDTIGYDGSLVKTEIYRGSMTTTPSISNDEGGNIFVQFERSPLTGLVGAGGSNDYAVWKYNPALELSWTKVLGTPGSNFDPKVVPDGFGGCYVLLSDVSLEPTPTYVVALSASGSKRWEAKFKSESLEIVKDIAVDSLNRLVFLCEDYIGGQVVIVVDRNGQFVWSDSRRNRHPRQFMSAIVPGVDGDLYLLSNDKSAEGSKDNTLDILVISKYSKLGGLQWSKRHIQENRTRSGVVTDSRGFVTRNGDLWYLANDNDIFPYSPTAQTLYINHISADGNLVGSRRLSGVIRRFTNPRLLTDSKDIIFTYVQDINDPNQLPGQVVSNVCRIPFFGQFGFEETGLGVFNRSVENDVFEDIDPGNPGLQFSDVDDFYAFTNEVPILDYVPAPNDDRWRTEALFIGGFTIGS